MQINRLFEIVYMLMNKKSTTAKELAEHFEVSVRTIYRDIETLCEAGIPIYTNKGKGGGICLMEQFVLNKSVLSEQEQNVILSALQGLKAATYPETDQVLIKLSSLFGSKNSDWIEADFSDWNNHEEGRQKFDRLKEAVLNRRVIQFDYYNSYGQESHRYAQPYKLYFKGQAWYLFGFCMEKKEFRFFKINRIKNLHLETETFEPQKTPELKPAYHLGRQREMQPLLLKVDAEMAYRVYDEFPPEALTKNEDGSFLIRTNMMPDAWLFGYLMSYEDHLELLEPEDLREELKNKYRNVIKKYKL